MQMVCLTHNANMWAFVFYLILYVGLEGISANQRPRSKLNLRGMPSRTWLKNLRKNDNECWMTLNAKEHFVTMEALEKKYASVRKTFDNEQYYDKYDEEILGTLLASRGATNREAQKHGNLKAAIPSGINLGGYSMMRMPDSVMFFHRMKLRNDTNFRVNFLNSNFTDMTLVGRLSLNDLHLIGNYERAQTHPKQPSVLYYTPSYGEVQILLRNVLYKMEGRYRLQRDRLFLEMIISELYIPYDGILMSYRSTNSTNPEQQTTLETKNIADFLDRLKTDLDLWLKDFFNEFLLDHPLKTIAEQNSFLIYDKQRVMNLNRYVDSCLKDLRDRLVSLKADTVKLPNFSIYTFNGLTLQLSDGTLTGLDSMYRRSMATNKKDEDVRSVDALIAFSTLKVRYSYEVSLTTGAPPLYGSLILTADELSALMSLSMVKEPAFVDLKFDFIQQLKPECLTVEGSVARVISNFKHVLELHIIAIMTNAMVYQVQQLSSLVKCVPTLVAQNNNLTGDTGADYNSIPGENTEINALNKKIYEKSCIKTDGKGKKTNECDTLYINENNCIFRTRPNRSELCCNSSFSLSGRGYDENTKIIYKHNGKGCIIQNPGRNFVCCFAFNKLPKIIKHKNKTRNSFQENGQLSLQVRPATKPRRTPPKRRITKHVISSEVTINNAENGDYDLTTTDMYNGDYDVTTKDLNGDYDITTDTVNGDDEMSRPAKKFKIQLDNLLTTVQPNLQDVIKRSFTNVILQQSKNGEQNKRDTLEDTSYFAKNTQVNLTRLELVKPPTFHVQSLSLDLKSMGLKLTCSLGEVSVRGLYSAFNENLYNLIPVMSEGHVLISLSNMTADVEVGLVLKDDAYCFINPGIQFVHDEVLVKLSWPSPQRGGGYEFATTEQLAKHIDDLPLTAAISLPLYALLREKLESHLKVVLRQATSVSDVMCSNPSLLEAYSSMVECLAQNGNKIIDMVLINMRRTLLQNCREVLEMPPLHATFMHKIGSISFVGKFETDTGWVKNLSTVNRISDVSVSTSDPMKSSFRATLRIKDLQVGYDDYRIKAMGVSCGGRLVATLVGCSLHLAMSVGLARWEPYAQLTDLRIDRMGAMDLHVTGLGPLSGAAPLAAAWLRGAALAAAAPAAAAQLQHEARIALQELPLWDILHAKQ